jgi:hypothetical protein
MSARAWILFLCLSSVVTAGAWAAGSTHSAGAPMTVKDARITLDLEYQVCRMLWLQSFDADPDPRELAGAAEALEPRRH